MQSYLNLDLQIVPAAQGYLAQVIFSPVGQAEALIVLPFSEHELQQPLDMLGGAVRQFRPVGDKANAGLPTVMPGELEPKKLGTQLFEAVMRGEIVVCLRRSLDAALRAEARLRIRLRLTGAPALAALPWEYLFDRSRDQFLALVDELSIVRYLDLPEPEAVLPVAPPLRVLAVLSDPVDIVPRLDVGREWALLQEAISGLGADQVVLDQLSAVTVDSLRQRLGADDVHVLHFIGHGWFDAGGNGLVCEDTAGRADKVAADVLGVLLHGHQALRLLFLNACEGARTDNAAAFSGTAQYLVRQGVPAVIAMQFPITDAAAMRLSQTFYGTLAKGVSVDAALTEARKAIYTLGSLLEWGTPVFFSRSADNRILALPNVTTTNVTPLQPDVPSKPFEPETVLIAAGPFRMGSDPEVDKDTKDDEQPQHSLYLPDYYIAKTPVTNIQYEAFVQATGHRRPDHWKMDKIPEGKEDNPVVWVTWLDAVAFCQWLAQITEKPYRLPTEAEWEKAARGPDGRIYPWGDHWETKLCNNQKSGPKDTTPVDAYPEGASYYGALDMAGNVWEWCATKWGKSYPYDVQEDEWTKGYLRGTDLRVLRGSSWFNVENSDFRCAYRDNKGSIEGWDSDRGFRVAVSHI